MDELPGSRGDLIAAPPPDGPAPEQPAISPDGDPPGDSDEIERAYRKALAAMENLPWVSADGTDSLAPSAASADGSLAPAVMEPGVAGENAPGESSPVTTIDVSLSNADAGGSQMAANAQRLRDVASGGLLNVNPAQVIEAALFVGGLPLSAKKFGSLLRGTIDNHAVERTIHQLNEQYLAEGRPYEIRPGDGGYRLELRPQYEKLRCRVYGAGPREVRLSQEALEVLALVAYQQPIGQVEIESHGKQNAGNLLRQLLRRDLVAIDRGRGGRKDVKYVTTSRFLSVFGLGSLSELPEPEDLARK